MAPVEEYLMSDRHAEMALARSAAPESISHEATVLVLGPHGYETAVEGRDGLVCVVERDGCPQPRLRSFGARKFGVRSASILPPHRPSCRVRTRVQRWSWRGERRLRSSTAIRQHSKKV